MGTKYSTQNQSGYNVSPPPDDGSLVAANVPKWADVKNKLGDPTLVLAQAMNVALVAALDFSGRQIAGNDTATAADHMRTVECTTTLTATLPDAVATGAGCTISYKNTGTGVVTIALNTATNTLDGTVNDTTTIPAGGSASFKINTAVTGYYTSGVSSQVAVLSVAVSSTSDTVLTNTQYSAALINMTGAVTTNQNVIVPSIAGQHTFVNNTSGAFTRTVKTAAGTGIIVPQGAAMSLYCDGTNIYAETGGDATTVQNGFTKSDYTTVAFTKTPGTGVQALSIKAGTYVSVNGTSVSFPAAAAVVLPALVAGTDYAVYACTDGTCRADSSFAAPTGYTTANSRLIGGFHFGLVASGTTVAGGSFATTGNGMIWVQSNVDDIAGINKYSLWDLKFRAASNNNNGMALVGGRTWVDIYLCSTNTATNGTSKYNTNIASGTVLPIIPTAFGGNGTTTYPTLNWWVANELARASQKRLMRESEFVDAAFGVTENQSIDATASTYPTTLRNVGYTSKYGIEQASGHQWTWGEDSSYDPQGTATPTNYDVNGNNGAGTGRGQDYLFTSLGLIRVLLGGTRSYGADSGSRASNWGNYPWVSGWSISLRAACDHLQSA